MKSLQSNRITHTLAAMVLATVGSSAFAAQTWDLDAGCGSTNSVVNSGANNCGAGVTLTGWSTATGAVGATTSDGNLHSATVYDWGANGLGIVGSNENSNDTGPHAADNKYGTDAYLFNFTNAVNLQSLKIGWNGTDNATTTNGVNYNDSDLQVFAWTGTGAPTVGGSNPLTAGWQLIGNFMNVGGITNPAANTQTFAATNGGSALYSSYWLISAFNSAWSGGVSGDANVDAFKLLALSGDTCAGTVQSGSTKCVPGNKVPEPGSLALVGLGLAGFVATRRKKTKAKLA